MPGTQNSSISASSCSIGSRKSSAKPSTSSSRTESPAVASAKNTAARMPAIPARALTVGPAITSTTTCDAREKRSSSQRTKRPERGARDSSHVMPDGPSARPR